MNSNNLKNILTDLAESEKPAARIDLWPAVQKSLAGSNGKLKQGTLNMNPQPVLRRAALTALALVVVFALLLATPQGQAFARELLGYFTLAPTTTLLPLPTPIPAPAYTLEAGLVTPQPTFTELQECGDVISPVSSTFLCQLQDAQAQLGFVIKSFPARYVQVPFENLWVDVELRRVRIRFSGYSLSQGLGDFPQDCPGCVIYADAIQPVQVGAYPAEYAAGGFIFEEDQSMTWDPGVRNYALRWKEGERWYALSIGPAVSGVEPAWSGLSPLEIQAKLITIAENLTSLEQGAEFLSAANQPSIKDSAGFAIKEPALLPEGFVQVPDGSWSNLTSMPRVGMAYEYRVDGRAVNLLTFYQMLLPADAQTLRREFALLYQSQSLVNGEWVDTGSNEKISIGGQTGYYVQGTEPGTVALSWRDAEREYLLVYQWMPDFGGHLDRETLIAIAENMEYIP